MFKRVLLAFFLILSLIAAGCQQEKSDEASKKPREKVKIQLYWSPDIEFFPFYAAEKHGFYQDENLDVELLHGGYDENEEYIEVLPVVLSGQAEFGLAGADQILLARARGEPVVAIAAIEQNNPTGFYSLADRQITKPEDLKGKRIWLWEEDISYLMFFHNTGLQQPEVTEVTDTTVLGETGYDGLIDGTVDAMIGYVYYEPTMLRSMGYETNFVLFYDYGVDLYPDLIFTTEQVIQEKPEAVQAFLNGTLHGMQYTFDHPDEIADYTVSQFGEQQTDFPDRESQKALLRALLRLVAPINSPFASRPGMMSLDIWQTTQADMLALGMLNEPLDLGQVYDTRFVEAHYASQKQ